MVFIFSCIIPFWALICSSSSILKYYYTYYATGPRKSHHSIAEIVLLNQILICVLYKQVKCSIAASSAYCKGKCPKFLLCGHACKNRCKDICTEECKEILNSQYRCPKGHQLKVKCYLQNSGKM